MTTMAAIDRVVHHSVILDLMGMESYRAQEAIDQTKKPKPTKDDHPPTQGDTRPNA